MDKTKKAKIIQESLANAVIESSINGVITINETGIIQSFNPAAERLFGYKSPEVLGSNIKMLVPEPYSSEHDQHLKNYVETNNSSILGVRLEVVGLRKNGSIFPGALEISETYLGETRMLTGFVHDISESKKAKEQLKRITQDMQMILDSAGEGIYGLDMEGKTTFVNPAAIKILGYSEDELIGRPQHALIHHSRPDGSPYPSEDCHINAAFKDGKVHRESEEVFWGKDGVPIPVEYVSSPISENGELAGAVVTFQDISQRKRTERIINEHMEKIKRANEMLFSSNKALDDFAYIVSHDLKEPLRGIYNYSGFLKEDYFDKLDEDGKSKLETIGRLSKRMEKLIDSILYFSRLGRGEPDFGPVDLNKVLAETLENMQSLINDFKVDVRMDKNFPAVHGDESRIGEVFQNLIANGIKYNDKPERWIEIGYLKNGEKNSSNDLMESGSETFPDGSSPSPVFFVKDNGVGILEKHFDSMFRIFKRLNGKDKFHDGTGVGTTIIKKIVEQHSGKIWLESKVGEGTTFYFTLGGKTGSAIN